MAQSFRELTVWQRAMEMTVQVYELTLGFPKEEIYGLTSQLRRASVSVASNIAEGRGRISQGEFRQFLGTAQGSDFEVQTQLEVSRRLGLGCEASLKRAEMLSVEVGKMLSALITSLQLKAKS
ncbi:MAG TPA: four helix bundle protein [Terracidiphilus sp.]